MINLPQRLKAAKIALSEVTPYNVDFEIMQIYMQRVADLENIKAEIARQDADALSVDYLYDNDSHEPE